MFLPSMFLVLVSRFVVHFLGAKIKDLGIASYPAITNLTVCISWQISSMAQWDVPMYCLNGLILLHIIL